MPRYLAFCVLVEVLDRVAQRDAGHGRGVLVEEGEEARAVRSPRQRSMPPTAFWIDLFVVVDQDFGDGDGVVELAALHEEPEVA